MAIWILGPAAATTVIATDRRAWPGSGFVCAARRTSRSVSQPILRSGVALGNARVVDLFAGPGGWDEGMRRLGVTDVLGIEIEARTCATARAAGHARLHADVADVVPDDYAGIAGLVASPPCTTFSAAGKGAGRTLLDHLVAAVPAVLEQKASVVKIAEECARILSAADDDCGDARAAAATSALVLEPARWIAATGPEWIAMEQVRAVAPVWDAYAHALKSLGYRTWTGILNAADYGVPQDRRRAILIASRTHQPGPPTPTHAKNPEAAALCGERREPWVSMADALGWNNPGARSYRRSRGAGMLARHGARPDTPATRPAPTVTGKARSDVWVTPHALRTDTRPGRDGKPRAARSVHEPAPTLVFGKRVNAVTWMLDRRTCCRDRHGNPYPTPAVDTSRPAPTVTSKSGGQWVAHARECTDTRRITVAEASVLQDFPPHYPWQGSASAQFAQIGNAVPPALAAAIVAEARGQDDRPVAA